MDNQATIVRVTVRGRVQGVGFRAFTQAEAIARGVTGWVRNRTNGDVEAVFAGAAKDVDALCKACRCGPPAALVEALEISEADVSALAEATNGGFHQLATR